MELDFTTDQEELRDTIRAVLAKESPVALVRERRRGPHAGKPADADALWGHDGRARLARAHRAGGSTAASGSAWSSSRSSPRSSAG